MSTTSDLLQSEKPVRRLRVAIIIPLEYHRGRSLECIRGWAQDQDYPRDRYQLLIGVPPDFDREQMAQIRGMLPSSDVMVSFEDHHDMGLVAKTANLANAELLLFSESHCVPEPDALSYLVGLSDAHPEWSALSAPTHALTHNLLSEIERDIYSDDIRSKLESHDWLRVLDQCFLIRQSAYESVGGFRAEFGHFAEWLLAAAMRVAGLHLGVADRAVVHHAYIGEYEDLEAFTTDFAYGQIKYLNECASEPAAGLFAPLPELEDFCQRTTAERQRLAMQAWRDLPRVLAAAWCMRQSTKLATLRTHLRWVLRLNKSAGRFAENGLRSASADAARARAKLSKAVAKGDAAEGRACFVEWFARLVQQGRFSYLRDVARRRAEQDVDREKNFPRWGSWYPNHAENLLRAFNVHDAEKTDLGEIRWTLPVFQLLVPWQAGRQRIVVEWTKNRMLQRSEFIAVRFNDRELEPHEWTLEPTRLIVDLQVKQSGWAELSLSVYPIQGRGDGRLLGLPLSRIVWLTDDGCLSENHTERNGASPYYFLHVPKCGGTTITTSISSAFASRDIFSPYLGSYGPDDFTFHPRRDEKPALYMGHFGWSILCSAAGRSARVSTVLRHPLERLLSRFDYAKQLGRVRAGLDFESWLRSSIRFGDTMLSQFVSSPQTCEATGGAALERESGRYQDEALHNLRSCGVVGLTEHLEDTINLLAMEIGFLPPRHLDHYNKTQSRRPMQSLAPNFVADVERWFAVDYALYEEATKLFTTQRIEKYAQLRVLDGKDRTQSVRDLLRRRYLDTLRRQIGPAHFGQRFAWTADDVVHGENLYQREHDGRGALRWTGPRADTTFVLPLDPNRDWQLDIRLHPATPVTNVESVRLAQVQKAIPLRLSNVETGYLLQGRLPGRRGVGGDQPLMELSLSSGLTREAAGFRQIGVAITGMTATCVG